MIYSPESFFLYYGKNIFLGRLLVKIIKSRMIFNNALLVQEKYIRGYLFPFYKLSYVKDNLKKTV